MGEAPLEELPLDDQLNELVELKLSRSKIKQPWHGTKVKVLYFIMSFYVA